MSRIDLALKQDALFIAKRAKTKEGEPDSEAMFRFRTYDPMYLCDLGRVYPICPKCYVIDSKGIQLHSIPSHTEEDVFRCGACNSEFVVP